jgi:hypothetical protein
MEDLKSIKVSLTIYTYYRILDEWNQPEEENGLNKPTKRGPRIKLRKNERITQLRHRQCCIKKKWILQLISQ